MNNSIFRSLEMIEARISEKLTVGNIAGSVYFSKYHYQRLFREAVGDSVMEYVTKRRLTLAGRELLETDASVLDAALKFGYDSHEGFTRSFKAYMGVTPTEYRKYGLTSISRNNVKERLSMTYSKNTDEILRELNDFIASAKETANSARKFESASDKPFWSGIADKTDALADNFKSVLARVSVINEKPDEITNRFAVIKAIDEAAFMTNLLALNAGLEASRGKQDGIRPICEKFRELAQASVLKAGKIAQFFGELSALIIEDMRKNAAEKIKTAVKNGEAAAAGITDCAYIKDEILNVVRALSETPELTAEHLEDCLFRLSIISFAADIDIGETAQTDGILRFKESLREAAEFTQTLVKPEQTESRNFLSDVAFQGNVMLFYTRREIENLCGLLVDEQRAAFDSVCAEIDDFIQFALNAADNTAYKSAADMLYTIHSDMTDEADKLGARGGAVRFLSNEFNGLANALAKYTAE